jgi:hypothetical protein
MDLQEQAIRHYADKMLGLAEELNIHPTTMFGTCLTMIRGLYTVLPAQKRLPGQPAPVYQRVRAPRPRGGTLAIC